MGTFFFGVAEYALCGAHLWGVSTIDYGLLSLFAYFHGEPKSLDLHLRTLFPVIYNNNNNVNNNDNNVDNIMV